MRKEEAQKAAEAEAEAESNRQRIEEEKRRAKKAAAASKKKAAAARDETLNVKPAAPRRLAKSSAKLSAESGEEADNKVSEVASAAIDTADLSLVEFAHRVACAPSPAPSPAPPSAAKDDSLLDFAHQLIAPVDEYVPID